MPTTNRDALNPQALSSLPTETPSTSNEADTVDLYAPTRGPVAHPCTRAPVRADMTGDLPHQSGTTKPTSSPLPGIDRMGGPRTIDHVRRDRARTLWAEAYALHRESEALAAQAKIYAGGPEQRHLTYRSLLMQKSARSLRERALQLEQGN